MQDPKQPRASNRHNRKSVHFLVYWLWWLGTQRKSVPTAGAIALKGGEREREMERERERERGVKQSEAMSVRRANRARSKHLPILQTNNNTSRRTITQRTQNATSAKATHGAATGWVWLGQKAGLLTRMGIGLGILGEGLVLLVKSMIRPKSCTLIEPLSPRFLDSHSL